LIIAILIVLGSKIFLDKGVIFGRSAQKKVVASDQISPKTVPNNMNKMIILTFGDISQTQYFNAIPILDKYGFKGSFFVTCNWVGTIDPDELANDYSDAHPGSRY
jgi:peptidoglycan/xylan/chitin deacetylase (PgdA/CDA1 family)